MEHKIRTDLALEVRESFPEDDVEIKGVVLTEEFAQEKKIRITTVAIKDEHGAKLMQKPVGTYITIEAPDLDKDSEDYCKPVSDLIAKYLKKLAGDLKNEEILVVGLGNREVTPDALGPQVIDNLFVTRHLIREYGEEFKKKNRLGSVSAISPGVMAQTGMETVEIIKGVIKETNPKLIIAIDALAARSISRLNTTVQIADTGICPGSGVGNDRKALNEESLGVKVIAIGVPTVVDASTIVADTLTKYMESTGFGEEDIFKFISEVNGTQMYNMFVTPKNIDEAVKRISYTISEALNSCFSQPAVS
ncbi:spore protease [Herbinix hemicellulosilytica]|uniref:Germination protease n=1 Tax=Herbinix hemicellulosilytica TaxID=1564487 RepID=A0A0H5SV89_HERHM|nr:GPR endopeptidase [Herbinix hemicellulosilytica]RBP60556.1 spore protease [Herbinix hemicellulosilytica]CRZ34243.1 Germination protease [Herbinix hemicellulosilytica]